MFRAEFRKKKDRTGKVVLLFALISVTACLISCGGGSTDSSVESGSTSGLSNPDPNTDPSSESWERVEVRQIQAGGMLMPFVKAMPDDNENIHIVYFTDGQSSDSLYTVNHSFVDGKTITASSPVAIAGIDNCRTLGLSIGPNNLPVVAYQGGRVRDCGSEQQSDAMLGIPEAGVWSEFIGGIGYVERNPVFQDGLAGRTLSVAVDSSGDIHLCYQFFYEGCDAMNFNYPDLLYVKKDGSNPSEDYPEETVEGNVYNANGTASVQNDAGDHADIILDRDDDPVIFYYADLSPNLSDPDRKGLRVARKKNGFWEHEWIETGIEVGDISGGLDRNGNPAVAYHVEGEYTDSLGTHKNCLKYAIKKASSWDIMMVDESILCGRHCSLAFNPSGDPAIAYYAIENHSGSISLEDLKFAEFAGSGWEIETVSSEGDIGLYNSLWFDDSGTAIICSYSDTLHTIYLFYR